MIMKVIWYKSVRRVNVSECDPRLGDGAVRCRVAAPQQGPRVRAVHVGVEELGRPNGSLGERRVVEDLAPSRKPRDHQAWNCTNTETHALFNVTFNTFYLWLKSVVENLAPSRKPGDHQAWNCTNTETHALFNVTFNTVYLWLKSVRWD